MKCWPFLLLALIAVDARLIGAPTQAAAIPGIPDSSISRLDSISRPSGTSTASGNDEPHRFSFEGSSNQHQPARLPGAGTPLFLVQAAAVKPGVWGGNSWSGPSGRHKGYSSPSSSSSGDDTARPVRSSHKSSNRGRSRVGSLRGGTAAAAYSDSTPAVSLLYISSQPASGSLGSQQQARHTSNSSGGGGGSSSRGVQVSRRHLQQSGACPEGCSPGYCVPAGNDPAAGFKCQQCVNNLVVDKATGKCGCPAGRYSARAESCSDCLKSHYCEGGVYAVGVIENQPVMRRCPDLMTTLGLRSTSARACVNLPGSYYTINALTGVTGAVTCPVNSYGPGLRKQRACVPCPPNYVTNGLTGRVSPVQCMIPPGFYMKAPGMIAPCPVGEWKDGTGPAGNCTKCAFGVTTPQEASQTAAACSVLLPGFYAAARASSGEVTATSACPQNFYCPGGSPGNVFDPSNPDAFPAEATTQRCPSGTWTQERGSVTVEQCLTPPGHYTSGGTTQICPDGSFRADWLPAQLASACTACGSGVQGDKSDRLTVYNLTTGATSLLPVMTTGGDCFIQPGQGLFYSSLSQTFRARNCEDNEYGVPSRFYGLSTYPCRPCPAGMVASNNSSLYPNSSAWFADNGDGTRGFFSERACVTQDGYGYSSRIAAPCSVGFYNPRDNYSPCTACPSSLTTSGVGAGRTLADCGLAAGYGFHSGAVTACPLGTYNAATYTAGTTTPCTACPANTTTAAVGATAASDCSLCLPGYGGAACGQQCGSEEAPATYGPAGRAVGRACTACAVSDTGYFFAVGSSTEEFIPDAVSPAGATSSLHCLAEFVQLADAAWWLPTTGNTNMDVSTGGTFADCVETCTTAVRCQYITYDYSVGTCYTRKAATATLAGTGWVGFKTVPSSDVGRTWSVDNSTSAKSSSGQYAWYQDPNHTSIGVQSAPSNVSSFTSIQDCLDACDDDALNCAGVVLKRAAQPVNTPKTCLLIRGDTTLGVNKRSMTRADTTRLALPAL